jgi:MFS family permease
MLLSVAGLSRYCYHCGRSGEECAIITDVNYLSVLRQPNFTKLWLAQILSQIAGNLLNFSLIILVYELTAGTRFGSFSVSLLVLSFSLPPILFATAAGVYVDFWDRKYILVVTNFLRAILALSFIWVDQQFWWILVISFAIATVAQLFLPAESATIPKVVDRKSLMVANSLFVFSMFAAFVIGYSASGPTVAVLGNQGPYMVAAVMFAAATLLTLGLPRQPVDRPEGHLPPPRIWEQIRQNWQLVQEQPERLFAMSQLAIIQGIGFILVTLAPALSQALLHLPLRQASHIVIIPVGIGLLMGLVMIHAVTHRWSKSSVIKICLLVAGFTLTLLGLSGQFYRLPQEGGQYTSAISIIVAVLMLMLGILIAMISTAAQTLLQESTSDHQRGRVFAALNMMVNIAATVPIFITGLLADLLSVTKVTVLIGVLVIVYSLITSWRFSRRRSQSASQQPDISARLL